MKFSQESLSPGAEKKRQITEQKMSKEVKFLKHGDVAHIGPDVKKGIVAGDEENIVKNVVNTGSEFNEGIDFENKEKINKVIKEKENAISALTKRKSFVKLYDFDYRKLAKKWITHKVAEGKDNLKTIPKSKIERSKRGEIREILHNPKDYIEINKKNPMDVMSEDDLL